MTPTQCAAVTSFPPLCSVEPYLEIAYTEGHKFYVKIEPYRPEELLTFIIGFVLCFYGGAFCTTIVTRACVGKYAP